MFSKLSVFQVDDFNNIKEQISGQNQHKCLVILPITDDNENNATLLSKIFAAVQLDLENDLTIYRWKVDDKPSLIQFLAEYPFTTCIIFGVPPLSLGLKMNMIPWKIIHLKEFSLLYCESLTKIAADQTLKKYLWDNLKQLWK